MPLLNRAIPISLLVCLQCSVRAMMLLERIPDQVVVRSTEFSLNVESYFSEPVLEFRVQSPDFLSFSSRKLAPRDIASLPLQETQGDLQSASAQGQDVFVLTKAFGLLVYSVQSGSTPQLLQHYFEEHICKRFQHVSAYGDIVALYNTSYVTIVDVTDRLFPLLLAESGFDLEVVKVIIQSNGQMLLVSKVAGVQLYDYSPEAGLILNKTFHLGADFHPTSAELVQSVLFFLDPANGLRSLTLETGSIQSFNLTGQRLFLANSTLVIDGCTVFDLKTVNTWTYAAPMTEGMFTVAGDVYFFGNSTHLVALNPVLNLSSVEERTDLADLAVHNGTLLEIRAREAVLRTFAPESAVLHGYTPGETGGFEVRFTARGKTNTVEAHFMLMVEAPPFEVLIYLLGGSSCVLLLAGLGCFLFKLAAERKQQPSVPGMHMMSEEFNSATHLPHPRQLGPMPEVN